MRTLLSSRRIFTVWYWFAAPLMVGASVIAFATNMFIGVAWSLLFVVWFWHSGKTNCSRCAYYGTLNCGVQGKIMAMLWQRQPMASASRNRIRWHYHFDLLIIAVLIGIYSLVPVLAPVAVIWSLGAWLISFGPKRYHGLLFRLKEPAAKVGRLSLPLVDSEDGSS